jgi:hypothetical protein
MKLIKKIILTIFVINVAFSCNKKKDENIECSTEANTLTLLVEDKKYIYKEFGGVQKTNDFISIIVPALQQSGSLPNFSIRVNISSSLIGNYQIINREKQPNGSILVGKSLICYISTKQYCGVNCEEDVAGDFIINQHDTQDKTLDGNFSAKICFRENSISAITKIEIKGCFNKLRYQ